MVPGPDTPPPADDLVPEVDTQLRAVAADYLRGPKGGGGDLTLQATALVHEAYLQLQRGEPRWRSRSRTHFAALAAKVMRNVLVDQLRARRAEKRGGARDRVTLHPDDAATPQPSVDVLELHDALAALERVDADQARVVELRFFGGMTGDEIAAELGVSRRTVVRELAMAQAWLSREMTRIRGDDGR
ncbi:MAG: sigma-70 family RNA polymerase sigma factor [Planctomycetes bacterium]|nr:sigma-70 family RNA polymerase sigma factor [Planctomycetota bacterium]